MYYLLIHYVVREKLVELIKSLSEITMKTFHNRRPSPLLHSHFKVDMARRIGAWHMSVCGRFQAFAPVKLPREALEDEERSRRDPPLPPYMPFAIPRVILVIGFSHAILCHEILQDFASYDENWRVTSMSYLDCNNYLILASQENDGVLFLLSLKIFFFSLAYSSRKVLETGFSRVHTNYIRARKSLINKINI